MISQEFARLARQVQRSTTVTESAVKLLDSLSDQIANLVTPEQIRALADQVKKNAKELAAAIAVHDSGEDKDSGEPPPPEIPEA